MSLPMWLRSKLEAEGLDPASGLSREARPRACRSCSSLVLRGLEADACAAVVEVDPRPLSQVGEALAILTGRATFGLWRCYRVGVRGGVELAGRRDALHIVGTWKRPRRFDVVAVHVCGALELPGCASVLDPYDQTTPTGDLDRPPF